MLKQLKGSWFLFKNKECIHYKRTVLKKNSIFYILEKIGEKSSFNGPMEIYYVLTEEGLGYMLADVPEPEWIDVC